MFPSWCLAFMWGRLIPHWVTYASMYVVELPSSAEACLGMRCTKTQDINHDFRCMCNCHDLPSQENRSTGKPALCFSTGSGNVQAHAIQEPSLPAIPLVRIHGVLWRSVRLLCKTYSCCFTSIYIVFLTLLIGPVIQLSSYTHSLLVLCFTQTGLKLYIT